MILCAVFRAIFLPATLVVDGCLRLPVVFACGRAGASNDEGEELGFGFICMILRARLGGGGRSTAVDSSLDFVAPDRVRLRWGLDKSYGDVGGLGPCLDSGFWSMVAGGKVSSASISNIFSFAGRSVELAGVGRGR